MKVVNDGDRHCLVAELSIEEAEILSNLLRSSVYEYRALQAGAVSEESKEKCRREAEKREKMCNVLYYGKEVTDD